LFAVLKAILGFIISGLKLNITDKALKASFYLQILFMAKICQMPGVGSFRLPPSSRQDLSVAFGTNKQIFRSVCSLAPPLTYFH
jgi:hypothetical protein